MKLQDYLHYYMGCNIIRTSKSGEYEDVIILDSNEYFRLNQETYPYSIKPILRKVEDITDEEWADIEPELIIPDAWGYYGIRDNFMKRTSPYRFDWAIVNEALIALRKRFVDVDNLIENGLAIDAKTINNKV